MKKQKIGLFFSDGLVGHEVVNKLFPKILDLGYDIALFPTGNVSIERGEIPELASPNFYESTLFHEVVVPFLDERKPFLSSDDKPIEGQHYSLNQLTQLHNLECHPTPDVNAPEFLDYLANDESIVGAVSIRNYQIFKQDIIDLFNSKGFLWNVHTGILPEYKGRYAPYWAIAGNEKEYGWTLHNVERGIDTGEIFDICKKPLDLNTSVLDTYMSVSQAGADMILGGLEQYAKHGVCNGTEQTEKEKQSYYTFPTAQEMNEWESKGIRFVDIAKVPDMYVSKFSVPGTGHAQQLRMHIIEAIGEYERGKEELSKLQTEKAVA